jgi:transportin-1
MEALVSGSALAPLIARCCVDDKPAVRQSAFALVGDLARACPGVLHPILPVIVTTALQILDPALMTQVGIQVQFSGSIPKLPRMNR